MVRNRRNNIFTLYTQYVFDVIILGLLLEIRCPGLELTAENAGSDRKMAV